MSFVDLNFIRADPWQGTFVISEGKCVPPPNWSKKVHLIPTPNFLPSLPSVSILWHPGSWELLRGYRAPPFNDSSLTLRAQPGH
jgi:hypothetical protein